MTKPQASFSRADHLSHSPTPPSAATIEAICPPFREQFVRPSESNFSEPNHHFSILFHALSMKQSVNTNRKHGRFLLTGPANLLQRPRLSESLAGRMGVDAQLLI
ncbi:MAG: hypothetical protein EAZ81_13470 [Verrucomicrobia bacterium]|nr:MAG: hypothetical protein EAZ81_13470 [Verrucomicrobiota bacterium]